MAFLCFWVVQSLCGWKRLNIYEDRLKKRGECQTKNKDFRVWCRVETNLQHVHQQMGQLSRGAKD